MRRMSVFCLVVALCGFTASTALADANFAVRGLGAELGIVSPEDVDMTVGFKVFTDFVKIDPNFTIEGSFDFWSASQSFVPYGEFGVRDIAFGVRGKYTFPTNNPRIMPFAALGLGMHFLHAEVTGVPYTTFNYEASDTQLGMDLGGGLRWATGDRTQFVTEAAYNFVSDFNHLSVKAGMVYLFE